MNPRFKFRRIPPREDITEIKERCSHDSVSIKLNDDSWNTTYRDDYVRHRNSKREIIPPPPVSISLGGGCLAPSREEMRSLYMSTFHPFDKQKPTPIKPPPDSEVIPRLNIPPVMSTAQEEMLNTSRAHREPRDIQSTRSMAQYNRDNHFRVGYDKVTSYTTTTGSSFTARGPGDVCKYDNANIGSHIEFDKNAGPGPHEKQRSKRRWAPPKPDVPRMDHSKTNFDTGYDKRDFSTTTQSSFFNGKMKPPERCQPPPCAEFSNHEPHVPKWRTRYQEEFKYRKPIPNNINLEDLRKTHWEVGHDKTEWPVHEPPATARREKIDQNQNESNIVFKGDGKMQFNTTTGDMIGTYDKSKSKPSPQNNESRDDHIYVGADKVNYESTAKSANALAGKGHPAQICESPDKGRGCAFAKGGDWSPYVGKEMVDIKRYKPCPPAVKHDGAYYRQTHFELEATEQFKPRYSTTYWKTICKPTLQP